MPREERRDEQGKHLNRLESEYAAGLVNDKMFRIGGDCLLQFIASNEAHMVSLAYGIH